jgi:pimeloyl-ACP methyl ester carboxylesterase
MMRFIFFVCGLIAIGFFGCTSEKQQPDRPVKKSVSAPRKAYLERLNKFETNLQYLGAAPQDWDEEPLAPGTRTVQYQSGDLKLKAYIVLPVYRAETYPAIVYFHGGFAFGASDLEDCQPFLDAGFAVMCPTLRGENGNPGNFELFLGEVEDGKAAINWLAEQPYIDKNRVYAFGHSVGAHVSALLSLRDNVAVKHTGGSGGLYGIDIFDDWSNIAPFPLDNQQEMELRLLRGNVQEMKFSHYAFIGEQDEYQMWLLQSRLNADKGKYLNIYTVPGDHYTSLDVAMKGYLKIIQSGGSKPR